MDMLHAGHTPDGETRDEHTTYLRESCRRPGLCLGKTKALVVAKDNMKRGSTAWLRMVVVRTPPWLCGCCVVDVERGSGEAGLDLGAG